MDANPRRWVGLGGLLFVVLLIVVTAIIANVPNNTASLAKVLSYYTQHKNAGYLSAFLLEAAVIVGLWFFWYLRNLLVDAGADKRLTTLGFVGALVFGVGGAVAGGTKFVMADAVNHVTPATLQGLNVLQDDLNTTLTAVGVALFLLATGIAIVQSGAVAKGLGWLAVVLGVISLPAILGPLPAGVWVLVTSIVLVGSSSSPNRQSAAATNSVG